MGLTLAHDWFSAPLPDNVQLAESCWLHSSYAFRHYRSRRPLGVRVGNHSGIYLGTFFELGPGGEVDIGDYCAIVGAIICTNARVEIGDHAYVSHEVVMADNVWDVPPNDQVMARDSAPSTKDPPLSIVLGRNSWIGARALLLGGARVGEGAIVGAGCVVSGNVPPYAVVGGNPARIVAWARGGAGEACRLERGA